MRSVEMMNEVNPDLGYEHSRFMRKAKTLWVEIGHQESHFQNFFGARVRVQVGKEIKAREGDIFKDRTASAEFWVQKECEAFWRLIEASAWGAKSGYKIGPKMHIRIGMPITKFASSSVVASPEHTRMQKSEARMKALKAEEQRQQAEKTKAEEEAKLTETEEKMELGKKLGKKAISLAKSIQNPKPHDEMWLTLIREAWEDHPTIKTRWMAERITEAVRGEFGEDNFVEEIELLRQHFEDP